MVWVFCIALTTDSGADAGATVEVQYLAESKKHGSVWTTFVYPTYIGVGETISECGFPFLNSPVNIRVDSSDVWYGAVYYYALHSPGKKRKHFLFKDFLHFLDHKRNSKVQSR